MKKLTRWLLCTAMILALTLPVSLTCFAQDAEGGADAGQKSESAQEADTAGQGGADTQKAAEAGQNQEAAKDAAAATEKNGDIMILFTSDVHCGINKGFGYAGLQQIRQNLDSQGYTTILVDDGDAIQGETIGLMSKGESIIEMMNEVHYDLAIPGNHEFDYGVDRFLELTKKADFPYLSCNFNKEGELVLAPYKILEAAGKKIAFVGVTTPQTLSSTNPSFFQDEKGNYIYGFMGDTTGEKLYQAVQTAVDDARAEGADYVYLIAHLGLEEAARPWTYADVISHTSGIDVVLDGHSHDQEQVVMKNREGKEVVRSAVGTKLNGIGYSHISSEKGIEKTDIWTWANKNSMPDLLGIRNSAQTLVDLKEADLEEELGHVIAKTPFPLTSYDPNVKNDSGSPVRMIRRAETNIGDLVADAFRAEAGTEIAIINGGAVRQDIGKGEIEYRDAIETLPFGNSIVIKEVTGQQLLDALEWGAGNVPSEFGGFLQVSGLTYEIDPSINNSCRQDENGAFAGVDGERRVKNVMIGEEPVDPDKTYFISGTDYLLADGGDGYTMFREAKLVTDTGFTDNQALIEYLTNTLGGEVSADYADPYGQDRIRILDSGN